MGRTRYTPEQRQAALDLYAIHGPADAARLMAERDVTVQPDTISMWASRAGVVGPHNEKLRNQVEATRLTFEERRQHLAEGLLDDVARLRRQMFASAKVHTFDKDGGFHTGELDEPTFSDKKAIGTTVAILIDKAQLLTGQATGRVEHTSKLDTEIEELVDELAANDPAPVEVGV